MVPVNMPVWARRLRLAHLTLDPGPEHSFCDFGTEERNPLTSFRCNGNSILARAGFKASPIKKALGPKAGVCSRPSENRCGQRRPGTWPGPLMSLDEFAKASRPDAPMIRWSGIVITTNPGPHLGRSASPLARSRSGGTKGSTLRSMRRFWALVISFRGKPGCLGIAVSGDF